MRYVDLAKLQLPLDWANRADTALAELRDEILAAEAAAIASGNDVATARRKAISDGLSKAARMKIWQELNQALSIISNEKCWYSESRNPTADKNVDHFRPKNRVEEDPLHEGYWWLAFTWGNYRYASQWCNQRRNDKKNGTSGGKTDHFPLAPGSFRARLESENFELEEVDLLDPIVPEEWKLLVFRQDGHPTPAAAPGLAAHRRAKISIDVYHLNCAELVNERRAIAGQIQRIIQDMDRLRPQITNGIMKTLYANQQREFLRKIAEDAEYSAAALSFARAEIYTLIGGKQVKRDWLAQMLP